MRLLLVEDEKRMAQALCEILRLEKYEVDHFDSGADDYLTKLFMTKELQSLARSVLDESSSDGVINGLIYYKTDKGGYTLANGGSFESADDGVDGALFSRDDLTINGSCALSVSSPAGHGIVCKDDLVLTDGSFTLVCGGGSENGIKSTQNGDGFTGGTFIGTGASGMAQSFSDSEQGVIALRVGSQSAGTQIVLKDSDGNTIITYSPELDFEIVIISSPDIVKGETYTLCVGSFQTSIDAS